MVYCRLWRQNIEQSKVGNSDCKNYQKEALVLRALQDRNRRPVATAIGSVRIAG